MKIGFTALIVYAPQAMALVLALVLLIPQWLEVYISIAEAGRLRHAILGALSTIWLSSILYSWNWEKTNHTIDGLYPDHGKLELDSQFKQWRDVKPFGSAALVPAAVVLGIVWAAWYCRELAASVATSVTMDPQLPVDLEVLQFRLMLGAIAVAVMFFLALSILAGIRWIHPFVNRSRWLATAVVLLAPLAFSPPALVEISRYLGPLAVFGLFGIALVTVVRVLLSVGPSMMSASIQFLQTAPPQVVDKMTRHWPALQQSALRKLVTALLVITLPMLALAAILVAWKGLTVQSRFAQGQPYKAPAEYGAPQFLQWLAARGVDTNAEPTGRFPVFVVAAQGGGIYAASSSMTLLASLQARCPGFARHVFAISAVSGGAIGAAAFAGLAAGQDPPSPAGGYSPPCREDAEPPTYTALVATIATGDHLSPLLASTLFDWVAKPLLLYPFADGGGPTTLGTVSSASWLFQGQSLASLPLPTKRSDALRSSFAVSYLAAIGSSRSNTIESRFNEFWAKYPLAPYLMLNATSAETGQRVTFSPFSLRGIGDGTLNSANDLARDWKLTADSDLSPLSLIDAAIISARFPMILPGWSIHHDVELTSRKGISRRRVNLVDGGYFDPSGAATAFDIMEHLKRIIAGSAGLSRHISLHLILLTDSKTLTDLSASDGSRLVDIGVPFQALLNSRAMLARRATLRAINELPSGEVFRIELDEDVVPLPLGWLLSETTHRVIREIVGSPTNHCGPRPLQSEDNTELRPLSPSRFQRLITLNSCAQREIIDLLSKSQS